MTRTKATPAFVAILFASSLFAIGCSTNSADAGAVLEVLEPYRTNVYFVVDRPNDFNDFVAYVFEGSVYVIRIKFQEDVIEPYIEVPRTRINTDYSSKLLDSTYVAWGLGGTLYVKDVEQFRGLILAKTERE